MVGALAGALQAAPAVAGLLFGENNIFSGKGRQASRESEKAFRSSQGMGIGQRYYDVLGSMQSRANRGLGASTLGLMERTAGRNTNAALSALGSSRNILRGIGSIAQAGQDAAMNIGAANESALSANRNRLNETELQIAGLEQQNMLRKNEEAQNYWQNRKAESNQAISSNLASLGSAIGSGLTMGAMNQQTKALGGLGDLFKSGLGQVAKQTVGQQIGSAAGQLATAAAPFMMPKFNRLPQFSQSRMMGGQYSGLGQPKSNLLRTPQFGFGG
jgi:hypothetical protein